MKGTKSIEKNGSSEPDNALQGDSEMEDVSTIVDEIDTNEENEQKQESTDKAEAPKDGDNMDTGSTNISEEPEENENANDSEDDDEEEEWDLKKIMSIAAVVRKSPIKCSHETCTLVAATVWVSNLKPSVNWYSCLDCQENDFGGWPDLEELPLKHMTQEHKDALIDKCSKYKDCNFPVFGETSPAKETTNVHPSIVSANAITPLSSTGSIGTLFGNLETAHSTVTPNHTEMEMDARNMASKKATGGTKPNKAQLEIHRKWQAAAEELGGAGARIVLQKPVAKKMIFDFLFDEFRPMNITEIHKGLKARIPSPILKTCLDDMALDHDSCNQFLEEDNESGDDDPRKNKSITLTAVSETDVQFKNALSFKGGKGSNSGLYYVNYNDVKGGSALDPMDKNQLVSDSANADVKLAILKSTLATTRSSIEKLMSEPMNAELSNLLKNAEADSREFLEKLEEARKLKVNGRLVQQTKKKIEHFASFWRKRRKTCMEFLITMEELTDGSVSLKKCQNGDGPIEIDCDEVCAKLATEFAKKKLDRLVPERSKENINIAASKLGCLSFNKIVAVVLDSQGKVQRVTVDKGDGSK